MPAWALVAVGAGAAAWVLAAEAAGVGYVEATGAVEGLQADKVSKKLINRPVQTGLLFSEIKRFICYILSEFAEKRLQQFPL
jgi:hypothetical protein